MGEGEERDDFALAGGVYSMLTEEEGESSGDDAVGEYGDGSDEETEDPGSFG